MKKIISKEADLIIYQKQGYRVPPSLDIRNRLGALPKVLPERLRKGKNLGVEFCTEDGGFRCQDCAHCGEITSGTITSLGLAAGEDAFLLTPNIDCRFTPDSLDPFWLTYFYRQDRTHGEVGFAARMKPCAVDISLLMVLTEQRALDKYQVPGRVLERIDPSKFPVEGDVKPNSPEELAAVALYQTIPEWPLRPSIPGYLKRLFRAGK